jgi:hypothetical protein
MNHDIHPVKTNGHGDYERRDIGIGGVLYFLAGLAVAGIVIHFVVAGLYKYLEKRSESQQRAVSPLVTNPSLDTRRIPRQYDEDYLRYLQEGFPSPQLEINERTELNEVRLREENILSTYDYVDKNAGAVRIPIDRAIDLLAQRGLPTRTQANSGEQSKTQPQTKGKKQ